APPAGIAPGRPAPTHPRGPAAAMENAPKSSHGRHGRGPSCSDGTGHGKGQVRRPNHLDHSDGLGGLGSSRDSIAATKPSNVSGPSKRCSSMKNVGVPLTPLRTPPRASSRIFGAYSPVSDRKSTRLNSSH